MLPSISIIIPTYNVEAYIVECLQSVAAQTYAGAMECIVVDDCGKDSSILLAEKFIKAYDGNINFKICYREKNGGLSAARNSGTDMATGDYIYYLDSDDAITPDCIERMVDVANKYENVDVVVGNAMFFNGREVYDLSAYPVYSNNSVQIMKALSYPNSLPITSWNKLLRHDFIKEAGLRFLEGVLYEDSNYAFHLARHVHSIAICTVSTYQYRSQRVGSISTSANKEKAFRSRIVSFNNCLDNLDCKYRDIQIISIFLRLNAMLCVMPSTDEAYRQWKQIRKRMLCDASWMLRLIIAPYMYMPRWLQCRGKVCEFFKTIVK